jgi:hypothetical protein
VTGVQTCALPISVESMERLLKKLTEFETNDDFLNSF